MSNITTLTNTVSPSSPLSGDTFPHGHGRSLREDTSSSSIECAVCPPEPRPNLEISSIPIEESQAFPEPRNDPQPAHWNSHLRGNPPYRALNRNQDFSIRPLGSNGGEFTFLCFMLSGVMIQNWANVAWRGTLGRLTDKVFRFKIGGTW